MCAGLIHCYNNIHLQRNKELESENEELQLDLSKKEQIANKKTRELEEVLCREQKAKQQLDQLQEEKDQLDKALIDKMASEDTLGDKVYSLEQE